MTRLPAWCTTTSQCTYPRTLPILSRVCSGQKLHLQAVILQPFHPKESLDTVPLEDEHADSAATPKAWRLVTQLVTTWQTRASCWGGDVIPHGMPHKFGTLTIIWRLVLFSQFAHRHSYTVEACQAVSKWRAGRGAMHRSPDGASIEHPRLVLKLDPAPGWGVSVPY